MEYTMGIDLGTSPVKVGLLSRSGKMTEVVSKKYGIDIPALGWTEQDPEEWWAAAKPQRRRFCISVWRREIR